MKKNILFIFMSLFSMCLKGQTPQKFSYQAIIRNSSNSLAINQKVGILISILQFSEKGLVVYSETHTSSTDANGLLNISIGDGSVVSGDFTKIDWSKGPYFVKTETDLLGGTNYLITTVSELMSVPYALYALNSQPGIQGDKGDVGSQGPIGITGTQGPQGIKGVSSNIKLRVSFTGDTLEFEKGKFIIIPGISLTVNKPVNGYGPYISDVDGNTYKTVYIGTQHWMADNLKVTRYNDFTSLSNLTDAKQWLNSKVGSWCYLNNDTINNKLYGKLYNYVAISNKNICPQGWHIPSADEWTILIKYLGGTNIAPIKMMVVATKLWGLNIKTTNSSMFNVFPAESRQYDGSFTNIQFSNFWSSTLTDPNIPHSLKFLRVNFNGKNTANPIPSSSILPNYSIDGLSVRCIKD